MLLRSDSSCSSSISSISSTVKVMTSILMRCYYVVLRDIIPCRLLSISTAVQVDGRMGFVKASLISQRRSCRPDHTTMLRVQDDLVRFRDPSMRRGVFLNTENEQA